MNQEDKRKAPRRVLCNVDYILFKARMSKSLICSFEPAIWPRDLGLKTEELMAEIFLGANVDVEEELAKF